MKSIQHGTKTMWNAKPHYATGLEIKVDIALAFNLEVINLQKIDSPKERATNILANWGNTRFEDNPDGWYHHLELSTYRANIKVREAIFPNAGFVNKIVHEK
jgi:hypothetical protein